MASSKLIELTYYDPKQEVRLTAFADTIILDTDGKDKIISAIRFGGYPEVVRGLSDAIYGGAAIEAVRGEDTLSLKSRPKGYQRQLSHDGMYTTATLMASDDMQSAEGPENSEDPEEAGESAKGAEKLDAQKQPRKCYIFCPSGDRDRLFEELDRKTAAPLIPAFRDYVLDTLAARGSLANEMLRNKRVQAHRAFDGLWKRRGMTRPDAYRWLAKEMNLPMKTAHIGGFDMAHCKKVLDLCKEERQKEAA